MIDDYTGQSVGYEAPADPNDYGDRTFSASATIRARYEARSTLVLNSSGQQEVSSGRIFTSTAITIDGRITYAGKAFRVISVESAEGLDGPSHTVAYLGG